MARTPTHEGWLIEATEPDGSTWTATWAEMVEANPDDEELLEQLDALTVGETILVGGGAQPEVTVRRMS